MRRLSLVALLLGSASLAPAQNPAPDADAGKAALGLNVGGHTNTVRALAFTPDGKKLITLDYGSVHVWDTATGVGERIWRLPQELINLAVSPDGKSVAVVGWEAAARSTIWRLDLVTGSARAFQHPIFGVWPLVFSPDSQRVAWGAPESAGVLDLKANRLTHRLGKQGADPKAFSKDGTRLLVTSVAKGEEALQVWDVTPPKQGTTVIQVERPVLTLEKSARQHAAWAEDGSRFASWQRNGKAVEILLWSADGKREWDADGKTPRIVAVDNFPNPQRLHFVGAERLLLLGMEANQLKLCSINVKTGKSEPVQAWPIQRQELPHSAISQDGKLVAATSGPGFQVLLYAPGQEKLVRRLGQPQPNPHAVGWGEDGRSIGWGFITGGKLVAGMNLSELEPLRGAAFKDGRKVREVPKGWEMKFEMTGRADGKTGMTLIHNGKRIETRVHQGLRTFTFDRDAQGKMRVFMGLGGGGLVLVDGQTGEIIHTFPTKARIDEMAVSPNRQFLLVAASSQVLDLYRVDGKPGLLLKILAAGQDWIAWTPQGYYAATPGGEKLMGWTVRTDNRTPLTFLPAEHFRKQLYRPDVIKLLLEKGNVVDALEAANAALRKSGVPVREGVADLEKLLPPRVTKFTIDKTKVPEVKITVEVEAGVKDQPIRSVRVFVDGRPFPGARLADYGNMGKQQTRETWTLTLPDGKHQVSVLVRSADASAISEEIAVDCRPVTERPVMHVLAIGINHYKDNDLNLGSAAEDAALIATTFKKTCAGDLFNEVRTHVLPNEKATRKAILEAIERLRTDEKAKAKWGDLVVVFFAGHGAKQKNQFYLLTHDAELDDLAKSALSGMVLRDALREFPCQVLLIMDACHSAGFGDKGKLTMKNLKPATDDATRAFTDGEVSAAVMCAAMGYEKAEERSGHGLFTKHLVGALTEKEGVPYHRGNNRQYVHDLHKHVFEKVSTESGEKQHPFLHLPWSVEPFAIRQMPVMSSREPFPIRKP